MLVITFVPNIYVSSETRKFGRLEIDTIPPPLLLTTCLNFCRLELAYQAETGTVTGS